MRTLYQKGGPSNETFEKQRAGNFVAMPYTAEQKRQQRAQAAREKGKPFKSRVKPHGLLLKHQAPPLLIEPEVREKTPELDMERARMEAEDFRGQIRRTLERDIAQAEEAQRVYFDNWLHPGQTVDLLPVVKKMLQFDAKELQIKKIQLVEKKSSDNWRLRVLDGAFRGKDLWCDLPEMCFC